MVILHLCFHRIVIDVGLNFNSFEKQYLSLSGNVYTVSHKENPLYWHFGLSLLLIPFLLLFEPRIDIAKNSSSLILFLKILIVLLMILSFFLNLRRIFFAWCLLLMVYCLALPLIFLLDMPIYSAKDPRVCYLFLAIFGIHNLFIRRKKYVTYLCYKKVKDRLLCKNTSDSQIN